MGMQDDLLYLGIMVFSFGMSFVNRRLPVGGQRAQFCAAVGVFLVMVICRTHSYHSILVVVGNLAVVKFSHISLVITFSYLAFFRVCHSLGLPKPNPHSNAVQLLITLRCIGLVFDIFTERVAKKDDPDADDLITEPTLAECFQYCFNFIGLFTGPYYSYKTHSDFNQSLYATRVPLVKHLVGPIVSLPILISILLMVEFFFSVDYVHSDQFYEENGFWYRLFYMVPIFSFLRLRCYTAWGLSKLCCIASGLGAYPVDCKTKVGHGPTDRKPLKNILNHPDPTVVQYDFNTVHNVDIRGCELAPTFRSAMKYWNSSVQYWLATHIYKNSPRQSRMALTMFVSAYWHGLHLGYFLSFLTIPLCTAAEDLVFEVVKGRQRAQELLTQDGRMRVLEVFSFDFVWWLFRVRGFEYMSMGFLLLSFHSTIRYWTSIYFSVHIALIAVIVVSLLILQSRKKSKTQ